MSSSDEINEVLWDLNRKLSIELWNLSTTNDSRGQQMSQLLIPQKRADSKGVRVDRISEQEARFACCALLEEDKTFYYSVETPTEQMYSFTQGGNPMSAQTDMSLYDMSERKKLVDIEFKAHQPPVKDIRKDFEKLVRETGRTNVTGNFYHLLERSNRGTLKRLGEKFVQSFNELGERTDMEHDWRDVSILFTICVREDTQEQSFALQRWFQADSVPSLESLKTFFDFSQFDKNQTMVSFNDWVLI